MELESLFAATTVNETVLEPLDEGFAVRSHWPAVFEKLDLLANKFTSLLREDLERRV